MTMTTTTIRPATRPVARFFKTQITYWVMIGIVLDACKPFVNVNDASIIAVLLPAFFIIAFTSALFIGRRAIPSILAIVSLALHAFVPSTASAIMYFIPWFTMTAVLYIAFARKYLAMPPGKTLEGLVALQRETWDRVVDCIRNNVPVTGELEALKMACSRVTGRRLVSHDAHEHGLFIVYDTGTGALVVISKERNETDVQLHGNARAITKT